ncbi:MAG: hypothetical protein GXO99_04735 [Nitrospirae bacterium]|nr:hypothetical protein [Nitrospirota bacterium]
MDKEESIKQAREIAQKMVDGTVDPSDGCDEIGKIGESLDYCDELLGFIHLSHLQTKHENLGFNKENSKKGIIEEAKKLLKNT